MDCFIHNEDNTMVGVDNHGCLLPTLPPTYMPNFPHIVFQHLRGLMSSVQMAPTVVSHNFSVIKRGSDIGYGIGHIAPNILFPVLIATSGSVSEFGTFTVLSGGKPTAIAIGGFTHLGINLNCSDPIPGASINIVYAPGCNMAGFKFSDFLASLVSIAIDIAISAISNWVGGQVIGGALGIVGKISVSAGLISALAASTKLGQNLSGKALGYLLGSPIGPSISDYSPFSLLGEASDEVINNIMIDNYETELFD